MTDEGETVPSRLASARAARGLTPAQVAEQMRLAPEVVLAMEEGRYADLGPAVFARGHLRKYAALLGVPAEAVLADYDGSSSRAAESTLIPPASAHTPVRDLDGARLTRAAAVVLALLLVAVAAAVGWWYWQSRVAPGTAGGAAAAAPSVPAGSADPVAEAVAEVAQPAQVPEAYPESAAAASPGRLALRFSGPSWLEVYDAGGRRLAFQLAEAGSEFAFDGPPPWRLVLGNAASAAVALDGNAVTIPASMRVQDAALVTLDGQGTVAPAPAEGDGQ